MSQHRPAQLGIRDRRMPWRRWCAVVVAGSVAALAVLPATAASAVTWPCADGAIPALGSTVSCTAPGVYTFAVPADLADISVAVVGAGGGDAGAHTGGNGAKVTGTATLPDATAYVQVVVGAPGTQDDGLYGATGGGGSALFALDIGAGLLAKLSVAGGGGGATPYVDGGDADHDGFGVSGATAGSGALGPVGGSRGMGSAGNGSPGDSDVPDAATVAGGGAGGASANGPAGSGGGGYGGGGGGGAEVGAPDLVASGGGGSSYADSTYVTGSATSVQPATGGTAGAVVLTFNAVAVPQP